MKAKVISVILAGLFLVGNVGVIFGENARIYKNVEQNTSENTITTEVYNGEQDKNLVPVTKHMIKYTENGTPAEKIIYKWSDDKGWSAYARYTYYYDFDGNMNALEYAQWDDSLNKWSSDPYLTMYIHTNEGDLLTIND